MHQRALLPVRHDRPAGTAAAWCGRLSSATRSERSLRTTRRSARYVSAPRALP